ncbi:hypothetical protein OIU84_002053 [Salix udensis]|uniref:Uncharacterized protein n=1 Tax=Salix udensis TaxID=889485 RepID=A0AAD6P7F0_9ROSI|nr:hypothetical protein OIU84_002053 [Salix udensis]
MDSFKRTPSSSMDQARSKHGGKHGGEATILSSVEYEWKPSRCEACQSFGHKCPAAEKTKEEGEKLTDGEHRHTYDRGKGTGRSFAAGEKRPSEAVGCGSRAAWPGADQSTGRVAAVGEAELIQISLSGMHFTWDNGQHGEHSILKKLDWVWGIIIAFVNLSRRLRAEFRGETCLRSRSYGSLVGSPLPCGKGKVQILEPMDPTREGYEESLSVFAWAVEVHGNPISRVTSKLRLLKGRLKSKLGHHTHDMTHKVIMAKEKWHAVQCQLDRNPRDLEIRRREREACYLYNKLNSDAESFFKQRSRVQWLKLGDKNTAYFHRSLLHRRARNHIHSFTSDTGEALSGQ